MKSSKAACKMEIDTIDKLKVILGPGRLCENDDGKYVIKPADEKAMTDAIAAIMSCGASVAPLSMKSSHVVVDVYVDTSDLNQILELDTTAMTIKAQVGTKFEDIVAAAAEKGFTVGVRPAGADATVEDWVYKEDAAIGSYKYGTVKDSVYNIVAIGAEGVPVTTGFDKIGYYMSAYNLIQTLAASNGKLAIITEVTFKLHPAGVTKAVAYQFNSVADLQAAYAKLVQEPSVKPLHISFTGSKTVMAFQGEEEFVDLDIQMTDAIMEEFKGAKEEAGALWDDIVNGDCVNPTLPTVYLPLKNMSAFIDAMPAIGDFQIKGNVPDRSTVAVKLVGEFEDKIDAIADKAAELGGRFTCKCHTSYRDESTKKFMKRIEDGFLGVKPEEPDRLSREVTPEIIEKLKDAIGANNVNTGSIDRIIYSHDLAPLPKEAGIAFNNIPDVIARVESVEDIAKVMKIAYEYGIPVTPRGNASWGLGGCMPVHGGILLDLTSKMKQVIEINEEEMYVKTYAGITWKNLLEACMKKGYIVGSYPSSFPSGTVGAWISTNGMGIGSYKYGSAKDNVLNMEVVLDDGSVVTTGFDHTGSYRAMYNLNQFFAGAEGTLGILGTVTFRIYPMGEIKCLAYEFDTLKAMNEPIQDLVRCPSVKPLHVAWSDAKHFENQERADWDAPDVTNVWLVTLQGDKAHNELEEAEIDAIAEKYNGRKLASEIAEGEWEERCYEFRARKLGVGEIPAEVIVPTHDWGTFTDECYNGFDVMKMEAGGVIGVMVDRSTTLFMPYYFKDDEKLTGMLAFGFNFYLGERAAVYGGRSTGFGVFFAWALDDLHDAATAELMRSVKTNLDSHDVVNPGHLVCGGTKLGITLSKGLMGFGSKFMQGMKKIMPKDHTFATNLDRFRYDQLEDRKYMDRFHKLGDGTQ